MNIQEFLQNKLNSNQTVLTEFESKELLQEIGIPIPGQKLTVSKNETISACINVNPCYIIFAEQAFTQRYTANR